MLNELNESKSLACGLETGGKVGTRATGAMEIPSEFAR
jgi:hypothetical protein